MDRGYTGMQFVGLYSRPRRSAGRKPLRPGIRVCAGYLVEANAAPASIIKDMFPSGIILFTHCT